MNGVCNVSDQNPRFEFSRSSISERFKSEMVRLDICRDDTGREKDGISIRNHAFVLMTSTVQDLLGQNPSSRSLVDYFINLSSIVQSDSASTPEIKAYSDVVYYNFYSLGLSLLFKPIEGYKPSTGSDLEKDKLILDSLDIYNIPKVSVSDSKARSKKKAETAFATHPVSPLTLNLAQVEESQSLSLPLQVARESTGKDFVQHLGEPDRKGGGSGPASGSIGIWCEWTKHGILVEFGGVEATGPQAWERGKDAGWKVVTVFR